MLDKSSERARNRIFVARRSRLHIYLRNSMFSAIVLKSAIIKTVIPLNSAKATYQDFLYSETQFTSTHSRALRHLSLESKNA